MGTIQDITRQKQIELVLKRNKSDLKFKNQIVESFIKYSGDKRYAKILRKILTRFNCKYGYFGYIDKKGDLFIPSFTGDIWKNEKAGKQPAIFPRESWSGMWGESLKSQKSYLRNSKLHTPGGHVNLKNALAVCIRYQKKLTGQIVLADKPGGFHKEDKKLLEEICNYISPMLQATLQEENFRNELIEAKERTEESDRLKSAFLANMSHEIRTPMNGILGFSKMLTRPNLPEEKKHLYSRILDDTGNQLLSLVNDILDISLIESGQLKISKESFNLNTLMSELYGLFSTQAENRNLQFDLKTEFTNEDANIETDKIRLNQILTNLLSNAFKFTPEGSVTYGYTLSDNNLKFYVRDTGIGIASENIDKVFERFRQEDLDMNRNFGGAGLGLSISKRLVELLGGRIWLQSRKGHGSTFCFTIPFSRSESGQKENGNPPQIAGKELTILLVEDDEVNRLYYEELLPEDQVTIIPCSDGMKAVDICAKDPSIDLVLMDIRLPGLNGLEATRMIRKFNMRLPIIAQTAFAMPDDKEKALAAGCNDYLAKPVKEDEFWRIVAQYV